MAAPSVSQDHGPSLRMLTKPGTPSTKKLLSWRPEPRASTVPHSESDCTGPEAYRQSISVKLVAGGEDTLQDAMDEAQTMKPTFDAMAAMTEKETNNPDGLNTNIDELFDESHQNCATVLNQ